MRVFSTVTIQSNDNESWLTLKVKIYSRLSVCLLKSLRGFKNLIHALIKYALAWKRIITCCAANIALSFQQYCSALLHLIQAWQYCSILFTTMDNVGSKTLLNLFLPNLISTSYNSLPFVQLSCRLKSKNSC